ncbi:Pre-mRNA-processing factor 39 [Ceratocystis lukuohia]|uniref:Pre-mRNA-processing factor 39 n=1 Tax=Ceratocystis lukuohia TaxID=2019550 RepID=A0ABR4MNC2_9PEZI
MADYEYAASDDDNLELKRLKSEVDSDPDSFEAWEKYVRAAEMEGTLNRNSSPQAISSFRSAYDAFLHKFPLFFGYWKKYADQEFNIAGPEAAEMPVREDSLCLLHGRYSLPLLQERPYDSPATGALLGVPDKDLFKAASCLFERGAACVGLDFLAHPFWDKYIEFEERQDAQDKVLAILMRLIHIPMHQYARYFERFRTLCHERPVKDLVSEENLIRFKKEVASEHAAYGGAPKSELEIERDIRGKIDIMYYEIFTRTQSETTKRWAFESEIKRPYFHVTELDNSQLVNWNKYLDFEESEGSNSRIIFLYERCLVACAHYDEFWFRYVRWMSSLPEKEEDMRNIYLRACTIHVPISRPGIRIQFAYFEESQGRIDVARAIHEAILMKLPECVEAVISWAQLERRQGSLDDAIQIFKTQIDSPQVDIFIKGALVAEWAFLLWKVKGSVAEARETFVTNMQWYVDSRIFWEKWIEFELEQPTTPETEAEQSKRIKQVFDNLRTKSRLSTGLKRAFTLRYLTYLQYRGGKDAMQQFLVVDREFFGPASVAVASRARSGGKEDGPTVIEMDEATRQKAESMYYNYYDFHCMTEDAALTGTAPFH